MKKIASIIIVLTLFFYACSNQDSDIKKLTKKMEDFNKVVKKATKDQFLNDKEIDNIKKLYKEIEDMQLSYYEDEIKMESLKKYNEENKSYVDKIHSDFYDSMMILYNCEGAEKL